MRKPILAAVVVVVCIASHANAEGGARGATATTCALVGPCGDTDGSGNVNATDALRTLRNAVGLPVALSCQCGGTPVAAPLLRTGQTTCFDVNEPGDAIPCAGTGQDGELRKGVARSFTDNGDGTITDNVTGLMWEKLDDSNKGGLAGIHDQNNSYTWPEAFVRIADLNFIAFAGHDDWRLPNPFELESLQNLGVLPSEGLYVAVYDAFFSNCVPGCSVESCSCTQGLYWTSTTDPYNRSYAWTVSHGEGLLTENNYKGYHAFVRAVRGGL